MCPSATLLHVHAVTTVRVHVMSMSWPCGPPLVDLRPGGCVEFRPTTSNSIESV